MPKDRLTGLILLVVLLNGCVRSAPLPDSTPVSTITRIVDNDIPATITPGAMVDTPAPATLCSPLGDIPLLKLQDFISNPFNTALVPDARDGGHPGTDFAYYTHPDTGKVMLGSPIRALLSGQVASISAGKSPFGNLVMIATPVDSLPGEVSALLTGYPQPTPSVPETHLTCPVAVERDPAWQLDHPAIYVLYAHMEKPAGLEIGDRVICGQIIGQVGNSGRSGNPHLHLEIRYGPGDATFGNMAHYSNDATAAEMATYCTWRVSGIFQAIDPMRVIDAVN